jgi:signal transduction histidine kinase
MPFRPKLRTVLLTLNILVLLLPLGGIAILRLYESELVRQTESELISQAALTASMFREIYLKKQPHPRLEPSRQADAATENDSEPTTDGEPPSLTPLHPQLDLANSRIREPALPAEPPTVAPDPRALAAGGELTTVLTDARRTVLSGIRIVDRNGIVVASSNAENGLSLAHREEVAAALKGDVTSLLRVRNSDELPPTLTSISRRARVRVFVAAPVLVDNQVIGAVVASRTPLDAAKALFLIRDQLLKAGVGLFLVVLLMTLLTAYYISRPVKRLIRQAERLQNGDGSGSEPLENPGIQEVAQLSEAIAEMAATIYQRSAYIKAFATNVSHEFKTPLTSIHGAVELLKDHFQEMSPEERERFLDIIDGETGRLERLVRRLLDLARADTAVAGAETCDAGAVIDALACRYRAMGVTLEVADSTGPLTIGMGREAFESVLTNLIDNARQYGGAGVTVRIDGHVLPDAGEFELIVHDNGPGISAGNRDKVFRPFFTTARETGGSGLGLAIVQSLLTAHGGLITLEPAGQGARFRVLVPLS